MSDLLKRFLKKTNMKKMCQGSISVFLILIMSPILTIAGVLVEATRVQEMHSYNQAAIDSAALSTLANYDPYLEERFGLFAFDQRENPEVKFHNYLKRNLEENNEKQTLLGTGSASGVYTLVNDEPSEVYHEYFGIADEYMALEQQITDFSQTTELMNSIYELSNVQELLTKSDEKTLFSELFKTITKVQFYLCDAKAFADDVDQFSEQIRILNELLNGSDSKKGFFEEYQDLRVNIASFQKKLEDDQVGFHLEEGSELWNLLETDVDYQTCVSDLFFSFHVFFDSLRDIYKALYDVRDSLMWLNCDLSVSFGGENTWIWIYDDNPKTREDYENVKAQFNNERNKILSSLNSFSSSVYTSVNNFDNLTKDQFGDFELIFPLVEHSESVERIQFILDCFIENDYGESVNRVLETLRLSFDLIYISNDYVAEFVAMEKDEASTLFKSFFPFDKEELSTFFNNIKNVAQSIFSAAGLYDGNLHATIGGNELKQLRGKEEHYSEFIESLACVVRSSTLLLESMNSFTEPVLSVYDLFSTSLQGTFTFAKAIKVLIDSVNNGFLEVYWMVAKRTKQLTEIASLFIDGNLARDLYEKILICSYIADNLPNRTTDFLNEESSTGYKYLELANRNGLNVQNSSQSAAKILSLYDILTHTIGETDVEKAIFDHTGAMSEFLDRAENRYNEWGTVGFSSYIDRVIQGAGVMATRNSFMGAEAEYFLGGTNCEIANQIAAFMEIYIIRSIFDIGPVMENTEIREMCAAGGPFAVIGEALFVLGEPLMDMAILVNGGSVPFMKAPEDVFLSASGLISYLKNKKSTNALGPTYKDYLFLAMMQKCTETDLLRYLTDVIEMEAREYYGNPDFQMDEAYVVLNFKANFKPNFLIDELFLDQLWKFEQERGY